MSKSDIYNLTVNRNEDILDDGPIIPRCYEVTYLKYSKSMSVNINKDEDKSKNINEEEEIVIRIFNDQMTIENNINDNKEEVKIQFR